MKVDGTPYRSIWAEPDGGRVRIIDQTLLPHRFEIRTLATPQDAAEAISVMRVRGAPLIGATAAWGLALAMAEDAGDGALEATCETLLATRPTAVNLRWAVERVRGALRETPAAKRPDTARELARALCDEDVEINRQIGDNGLEVLRHAWTARVDKRAPLRILTHCNAGWLATVDWGTALAPIYRAHEEGIDVHVWVDETRPRNQGAALTAWELAAHGIAHQVIVDNAGGHLMGAGEVDLVITGTDRTAANGDVANKIGTYLKALAARDNDVPFYVALPGPTIDWHAPSGAAIPIETRAPDEVTHLEGFDEKAGEVRRVRITPPGVKAHNPAFDVTPARLVTGLITERGVCNASVDGLAALYPERSGAAA